MNIKKLNLIVMALLLAIMFVGTETFAAEKKAAKKAKKAGKDRKGVVA